MLAAKQISTRLLPKIIHFQTFEKFSSKAKNPIKCQFYKNNPSHREQIYNVSQNLLVFKLRKLKLMNLEWFSDSQK